MTFVGMKPHDKLMALIRKMVQATSHKNSTGLYNIHLYYILNDGSRVGVGGTTTTVEFRNAKTKTQTYITNVNSEAGSFYSSS